MQGAAWGGRAGRRSGRAVSVSCRVDPPAPRPGRASGHDGTGWSFAGRSIQSRRGRSGGASPHLIFVALPSEGFAMAQLVLRILITTLGARFVATDAAS